jgi:hypothetical protein
MDTSTQSVQRINIILDKPSDWLPWLFVIKDLATQSDVWEYIDPSKTTVSTLTIPERPHPQSVKPDATSIADLDDSQIPRWNAIYRDYEDQKRDYLRQKLALDRIATYITTSISVTHIDLIRNQPSVHDRLVILQKLLAPTDESRSREIEERYRSLRTYSGNQSLEGWIESWRSTVAIARELELPEVNGNRAQKDFVAAISTIHPEFGGPMSYDLLRKEMAKESLPELEDLIEMFQNYIRMLPKRLSYLGTFSTLGIATPTCICGDIHWFSDCPYVNPTIREPGWKPDPSIQTSVERKLRNDPTLQDKINRSIENGKRKATQAQAQTQD